jgi:hypothetical protein
MAVALLNRDVTYSILELLGIQDLVSVALVSKQFTSVARKLLFRNVVLNCRSFRRDIQLVNFNLFARALRGNSALSGLVRNLELDADFDQGISFHQLQQLLATLCNLQHLSLRVTETPPLTGLLWGCLTSVPLTSPRLRTIKIEGSHPSLLQSEEQHIAQVRDTITLETLELAINTSLDALHGALIPLRLLKSLSCRVPDANRPDDDYISMSPMAFASSLRPVAATLTELKVIHCNRTWRTHDTSRLDLSSFNTLRGLAVPHFLLFQSYEANTSRAGVYRLLPPTLRKLEVFKDRTSPNH